MKKFFVKSAAFLAVFISFAHTAKAAPVIAGFERFKADDSVSLAARGELLLADLNCLACHMARSSIIDRVGGKAAPDLSQAGARLTPKYIRDFLMNPHGEKPGTTMPDLFHASGGDRKSGAIEFLVHFLASKGGPIKPSRTAISNVAADVGRQLYQTVGCVACHAPEDAEGIETPIVPLPTNLAAKTTVEELTKFLQSPLHVRPSGRMPSLGLDESEARNIAVYLLRDQMENPQAEESKGVAVAGWRYEYYEVNGMKVLPDFSQLEPKQAGVIPEPSLEPAGLKRRNDYFAFRYTANLKIEKAGKYRFWLRSDDGSRLVIDGKVVANNDGIHPGKEVKAEVKLSTGVHAIEVQYFEAGGGEEFRLQASGPSFGKRGTIKTEFASVPNQTPMVPLGWEELAVDPEKARMGKLMFSAVRCASCHRLDDLKPLRPAPVLSELNLDSSSGCLGTGVRRSVPQYHLSDDQREALKAALRDQPALAKRRSSEAGIKHGLAAHNCYACHKRGELGGPDDIRSKHFKTNVTVDLGEEGKRPPHLNRVGSKLKKSALRSIIYDGELHTRYFMATRMPRFGRGNVDRLIEDLVKVDLEPGDLVKPEFSEDSLAVGRRLVGQTGLFCINCHLVNEGKGPGIPGIDLVTVHKRLNPGWFNKLLANPLAMNEGTLMPAFWPEGQSPLPNVLGGDTKKQMAAIWNYLSLGESMPLPIGIQPVGGVGMELIPVQEPIIHRTFMEDVGPRSILVGFPERVHVAFDANTVRLAKVWRGRFFDGSGVASGRTDKFLKPLGKDVTDMPPGPAFAVLESQSDPWPAPAKTDRNVGGKFRGYSLDDKQRPTLRYVLNGVTIEEKVVPVLRQGGSVLRREFKLTGEKAKNLYLLVGSGKDVDHTSTTDWIVDGTLELQIDGDGAGEGIVRESDNGKQLLLPVKFTGGKAAFSVTLVW